MLKKRIIGSITVLNGWAVQSIGYSQYLPLGRPSVIAENLDRWGADEILIWIPQTSLAIGSTIFFISVFHQFILKIKEN